MHTINIQDAVPTASFPSIEKLMSWAEAALDAEQTPPAEVTIRIVDKNEITELNSTYRKKNYATNVLSFPIGETFPGEDQLSLGDIIICAEVVNQEAKDQKKKTEDHWTHMVIHGVLHLLGYDHERDEDAEKMEAHEIAILSKFNITNPYEHGDKENHHD